MASYLPRSCELDSSSPSGSLILFCGYSVFKGQILLFCSFLLLSRSRGTSASIPTSEDKVKDNFRKILTKKYLDFAHVLLHSTS